MTINLSSELKRKFPDLRVLTFSMRGLKITKKNSELERLSLIHI